MSNFAFQESNDAMAANALTGAASYRDSWSDAQEVLIAGEPARRRDSASVS